MKLFAFPLLVLALCVGCSEKNSEIAVSVEDGLEQRFEAYFNAQQSYFEALPEDRYHALVKKLASEHPQAIEFRELYPKAYQISGRMVSRGSLPELSASGMCPDELRLEAPLYGRYTFTCVIPFYLTPDYKSVERYGEPYFHIDEYTRFDKMPSRESRGVSVRPVFFPDGNHRLDIDGWKLLKRHRGDWSQIGMGPWVRTDAPWPSFDEYCLKNMWIIQNR